MSFPFVKINDFSKESLSFYNTTFCVGARTGAGIEVKLSKHG